MRALLFSVLLACIALPASAENDSDLATKLSNPISSLISVPFQFNYDCCNGPSSGARFTLNIQPVIPFPMTPDWNLIVRTIMPIIQQDEIAPGFGSHFGLSDTTQSFFLSPNSAPGDIIWGVGPVFLWPTATDAAIGTQKWGAGPTVVILQQRSGWTYGILANHIWSYAGSSATPNVNSAFLQPFLTYTWPDTTGLALNTESTYDWTRRQWTVPLNLTLSRIFRLAAQPVSFQFAGRYYAEHPDETASWGLRFSAVLLFPD
jgi:hypothetical protein